MENNTIRSIFSIREAFRFAWMKLKTSWKVLVPATIILLIISALFSRQPMGETSISMDILQFIWSILQIFISMGFAYIGIRIARNEEVGWKHFLVPKTRFWKYLGASILFALPIVLLFIVILAIFAGAFFAGGGMMSGLATIGTAAGIAFVVAIGLSLWYMSVFYFYQYIVVDQNKKPVQALKEAARMTKGSRRKLVVVTILLIAFNVVGAILAFAGLIITMPMTIIILAYIYEKLRMHANGESAEFPIVQPKEILAPETTTS